MRILRIMARILSGLAISFLLPLVLLWPRVAFADDGGGKNHGNLDGGYSGYLGGGNQGRYNQGGDNQGGGGNNQGGNGNGGNGNGGGGGDPAGAPDSAPEINMASINSAMALLVGGAMWLRHRK